MTRKEKVLMDVKIMDEKDFFQKYDLEFTGLKSLPTEETWPLFANKICPEFCGFEETDDCNSNSNCIECWNRECSEPIPENLGDLIKDKVKKVLEKSVGKSFADDIMESMDDETGMTFSSAVLVTLEKTNDYSTESIQEAIGTEFVARMGLYE